MSTHAREPSLRPRRGAAPTPSARVVGEETRDGPVPVARVPGWEERFPWLVHGVTLRGPVDAPFDLALFGAGEAAAVQGRWAALIRATGMERVVHGRQVHGPAVRLHREGPPGLELVPDTDGHVTAAPGVLLAVTVADCVPVLVVDAVRRAVAVLHAGWRGIAAGVLETGMTSLAERLGSRPDDLHVHLGPAICGRCYEVGPEVHEALGLAVPEAPTPVDLRALLVRRALEAGVPEGRITVSGWCTRCGDSPFFSHRAGDRERQVAFAGIRR